jgi:hypothetical protein
LSKKIRRRRRKYIKRKTRIKLEKKRKKKKGASSEGQVVSVRNRLTFGIITRLGKTTQVSL